MGVPSAKNVLTGFAHYLAEHQFLDKDVALNAFQQAATNKISYIEYLITQKLIDETSLASISAAYFGLPSCDIDAFNSNIAGEYLNIQVIKKRMALPLFKKNGLLYLAVIDPTLESLNEIKFLTNLDTRLLIAEASKLKNVIDELLNSRILAEINTGEGENLANITVDTYKEEKEDLSSYDVDSAPVVNYINRVLLDAIEKKASDVHFEHYENTYRIRFRQQGILYPITSPPFKIANYLLARLKVMSNLDITEHRIPQDGRFKLTLSQKRAVDFRVSVCPTIFGEKVVLRILDASQSAQNINSLGLDEEQYQFYMDALNCSQGMILVTGPTGSGKTVTLYSGLNYLNSPEKNISTVEDPVEIPIQGINQVHVNIKTGLTFSSALRAFLRQDPDIIMVGEIRDLETAEIATKAAQTGHLVLSTLHTNSAPETIVRLVNMGIQSYNLASSLKIIIAQRLVRVLCNNCKVVEKLSDEALLHEGFSKEDLGTFQLYTAKGCEQCLRGFKGRVAIFEVMPISEDMKQLITDGANAIQIAAQAKKENICNLRESGLKKVKAGITTLAELNRVFK